MCLLRILTLLTFAAGLCMTAAAEEPRVFLAEDWSPPILEGIELPDGMTTLTISPDGEKAAAAVAGAEADRASAILLYSLHAPEPAVVGVKGIVRDLLFEPDSRSVLGLLHRPAKKREGDTYLIRLDFDAPKPRRMVHLPPSARGMDYWPHRGTLLVAVRNEVRTLTLPGLRSGPLYRVPGENLAVASLGDASSIVIGQDEALLLVNLDDPPGEEAMPVRERHALSRPVVSLAAANDGTRLLARLDDGTVWSILTEPLRAEQLGGSAMLVGTERILPAVPRTNLDPSPAEPELVILPTPAAAAAVTAIEAEPEVAPATATEAPVEELAPVAPVDTAPGSGPQLSGKIAGPAAVMVAHVVLFGPDNILREARRISPEPDGSWQADDLPAGRYRVQLDGGGNLVLVTEPPSMILEIPVEGSVKAEEFRVLEAL